eukprot:6458189-Amphidinium_carterae.1
MKCITASSGGHISATFRSSSWAAIRSMPMKYSIGRQYVGKELALPMSSSLLLAALPVAKT